MVFKEDSNLIKEQCSDDCFLYPMYNKNCISNIPGTILHLFDIPAERKLPFDLSMKTPDVNKVVLFVLDGFGYNQFLHYYKQTQFLANLVENADVYPLTSVFPSQTTNALTTLNTGLTPQEHGLFEYYLYFKEVDRIISTLSFDPLGSKRRNELIDKGFDPNVLFNGNTIQKKLRKSGVRTYVHIYSGYAYSNYCRLLFDENNIVPSLKSSDLIVNLKKTLEKESGPAYFFVHLSNLDTISHEYGPKSYEFSAELSAISYLLQKELISKIDKKTAQETMILFTSDHGEVDINPQSTMYLNEFPGFINTLRKAKNGKRIFPTGSARDIFLHLDEEKLNDTMNLLKQKIGTKARVLKTKEAIKTGLFGIGDATKEFLERVGNCLILPYGKETIWYEHFKGRRLNLLGHHGGLNKEEMLVPLAINRLSNLK
ncbi:MAG: alkaline phosphatase family protein [Candidatus Bathyarchaeota archaeon]|jgi:hypothetical protein